MIIYINIYIFNLSNVLIELIILLLENLFTNKNRKKEFILGIKRFNYSLLYLI